MPELLNLETLDWTLSVWCKDISNARHLLSETLSSRDSLPPPTRLKFSPALHLTDLDEKFEQFEPFDVPVFFENKLYEFDFQFRDRDIQNPEIKHRLISIEDAFHLSGNSLRGSINFGNNVGWFKLDLNYKNNEKKSISQKLSFEVLPTKMDLDSDISAIHQIIDNKYPLLRFSFAQKTDQELSRSRKPHERFPLLWLSHFESLRVELEKGVKYILRAPHSRLLAYNKKLRAEQLRGRLSPSLEESIGVSLANNDMQRRYSITSKVLSIDTPENRFIKMVLVRCSKELSLFLIRAKQNNSSPENSRLSESFFSELNSWKKPLDQYLKHPLFKEVGDYEGLANESLVLHQKHGYANVYRIWQQLKLYLDVFGQQASISMKSIAELYEIWCVLEVRRILIEDLGFDEIKSRKISLYEKGFEKELRDGMGAAFNLKRGGISIRLAHEPLFRRPNTPEVGRIYSWTTNQKPDILLEAEFESGEKIRWIFDAKYRISQDDQTVDLAPDDAINQMHRYRDALIYIHKSDDSWNEKKRPIFGAFVLYPGWFEDGQTKNPYSEAIDEVGIGAFPLLPNSENHWLKDFLVRQLGVSTTYPEKGSDFHYVQEASRISYTGMELTRYSDLTLAVSLGGKRDEVYKDKFLNGSAAWYHIPLKTTLDNKIQIAAIREIKHCSFIVYNKINKTRSIEYIYEVISVQLLKRNKITREQAGARIKPENSEKEYWLFELGRAIRLEPNVNVAGIRDNQFKFRLIGIEDLERSIDWSDLPDRYSFLQD